MLRRQAKRHSKKLESDPEQPGGEEVVNPLASRLA
jgi:hypothetical protein